jgi:hypothetical protein
VLKLIYHTAVFGPIHLEYSQPAIRVGRSEDNDLVLRHPSVEPHHCLLVFREEKVLCLPPTQHLPSEFDLQGLTGPEFGPGDRLRIGEVEFSLVHSPRTVSIPEVHRPDPRVGAWRDDHLNGPEEEVSDGRYFCAHCQLLLSTTEVKRVGLVGHAKRYLCPKCSSILDVEPEPTKRVTRPKR